MRAEDGPPSPQAAVEAFAEALRDPEAAQAELLRSILEENAGTEFGRAHRFDRLRTPRDFRQAVPVASGADFTPHLDRAFDGAPNVLVPGQPVFFGRTSGTSGKPKNVGYPARIHLEYEGANYPMLAAMEAAHPSSTGCVLLVTGKHHEGVSPAGIPYGSASGFVRNLPCFEKLPYLHFAPEPVMEMIDVDARYYAMLRFALAADVRMLSVLNPSTMLTLLGKAAEFGDRLAHDLERGGLASGPPEAVEVGARLGELLRPAPEAAARLRRALGGRWGFDPCVAWPNLAVLQTWKGGAASHYLEALRERCPGRPMWSATSGATEAMMMLPLRAEWAGGVPALRSTYLELFPEGDEPGAAEPPPIRELGLGGNFRVAVTNRRGMYRYLMDDVFQVEALHEGVPVLRFSHRAGLVSSLTGEKLTEQDIVRAVEEAIAATGLVPADYQAGAEWGEPPAYALVVEPAGGVFPGGEQFLRTFEQALCRLNIEYASKRHSFRLAPPRLLVVAPGHFDRLRRARVGQGRSDAQVKTPRLLRELLDRAALGSSEVLTLSGP